jgi:hypothetical protein
MAETQNFDKLNILKRRSEPYADYFGDMLITDKQKKQRIDLAFILEDALAIYFEFIAQRIETGTLNPVTDKQQLVYMFYDSISGKDDIYLSDEDLDKYVIKTAEEIYKTTVNNMAKTPNDMSYDGETPYWVSGDRAMFVAENEANTIYNTSDYNKALIDGKNYKVWQVYPDNRVRQTHIDVYGVTIPIDAYFDVGMARMLYPKDVTSEFSTGAEHPEEVIGCRCSILYINK